MKYLTIIEIGLIQTIFEQIDYFKNLLLELKDDEQIKIVKKQINDLEETFDKIYMEV